MSPHGALLNRGGKSFVSITASSGTGELHKGHGIAIADLDRDGDADIVAEVGGAVPADRHGLRLFENPGNRNDWINLRLVGVKSNRAAIGARIKITVENAAAGANPPAARSIHRTVGSGGSFGANPMEQHVGLGPSARIQTSRSAAGQQHPANPNVMPTSRSRSRNWRRTTPRSTGAVSPAAEQGTIGRVGRVGPVGLVGPVGRVPPAVLSHPPLPQRPASQKERMLPADRQRCRAGLRRRAAP
jgi:hypothetical protein